ncbi:hypothetical protein ASH01_19605 [Terrabacter sp. Soil811]|uniref:hypothetical protein n=1 Tax=Terrabacter sp. Soil811 TaxID=1736419 RepID=UPI0006FC0001|nr:hypothetical protein [Terrabacter sp. Soil811]KRF39996.1 hypothetical protein ASH01_19605 [Terrabacter sp. Soil811]
MADWLRNETPATDFQVAVTQSILEALEGGLILGSEPLAAPNLTFTVYWCDYVLRQHQMDRPKRQPQKGLTLETVKSSLAIFDDSLSDELRRSDWLAKLRAKANGAPLHLDPLPQCDRLLEAMRAEFMQHVNETADPGNLSVAVTLGRELATSALMVAPYPPTAFEFALRRSLSASPVVSFGDALTLALNRHSDKHAVLLGVCGVKLPDKPIPAFAEREIGRVVVSRPPAWVAADQPGWAEFVRVATRADDPVGYERAGVVQEFVVVRDVWAVDSDDAATKAASLVEEALSELMVAKPDISPIIFEYCLVGLHAGHASSGPARIALSRHSYETMGAVTRHWSSSMAYILAAAANARRQPIPSTRASLAWSVLEGLDVSDPSIRDDLVTALSLLVLRQTCLNAYSSFMLEAPVRGRRSKHARDALTKLRRRRSRWLARLATAHDLAPDVQKSLESRSEAALAAMAYEEAQLEEELRTSETNLEVLRAGVASLPFIEKYPDLNATLGRRVWLADHREWEAYLARAADWNSGDKTEQLLWQVLKGASPLAQAKVYEASSLLRSDQLASYFTARSNAIRLLLLQIYALRNLSQHSGEQVEFGVELLASGALLLLDGLLDVLATWSVDLLDETRTPVEVLKSVAFLACDVLSADRAKPLTLATGVSPNQALEGMP